jgi:hypothetical protein
MTTHTEAKEPNARVRWVRDATGWIGLAASPACVLMAWLAAMDAPRMALCSPASAMPPIDGMAGMYLLMNFLHVSPWLKLAFDRPRQHTFRT